MATCITLYIQKQTPKLIQQFNTLELQVQKPRDVNLILGIFDYLVMKINIFNSLIQIKNIQTTPSCCSCICVNPQSINLQQQQQQKECFLYHHLLPQILVVYCCQNNQVDLDLTFLINFNQIILRLRPVDANKQQINQNPKQTSQDESHGQFESNKQLKRQQDKYKYIDIRM
ncbi:unnamed protein product [Paramecium octaurelia]|uniref:Uncharacterized protein n=1 Tax=Paramecium octaurelia TaxID=43137 RepID=A0A8S1UEU2_PAROT|nr:unnamed protein product [Paramecium octaurelia]